MQEIDAGTVTCGRLVEGAAERVNHSLHVTPGSRVYRFAAWSVRRHILPLQPYQRPPESRTIHR